MEAWNLMAHILAMDPQKTMPFDPEAKMVKSYPISKQNTNLVIQISQR